MLYCFYSIREYYARCGACQVNMLAHLRAWLALKDKTHAEPLVLRASFFRRRRGIIRLPPWFA